jgi:hypothetical protein
LAQSQPYALATHGSLSGGTGAATVALQASAQQGDTLLLGICTNAVCTITVTDSQGNSWGQVFADTNQSLAMLYVFQADGVNALGAGADTLTISYGGTDPVVHDWVLMDVPGQPSPQSAAVDCNAVPADGSSATATSNVVVPVYAGELAISFVANANQAVAWGSGFNFQASTTDSVHSRLSCATKQLSGTPASVSASATFTSCEWAIALFTVPPPVTVTQDSLVINENIELLGGGVTSAIPQCAGASFRLVVGGYDLSAPQPTTDIVGSLLLDGERPFGRRASNRTMKLSVQIRAPNFILLAAAREVLMQAVDQQTWTLRWTRKPDTTSPNLNYLGSGNTITTLPVIYDCFRAQPSVVMWGGYDKINRTPYGQVDLTFSALPYGRSDLPVLTSFQSPIAGQVSPPASVTIDNYTELVGQHLLGNVDGTFESGVGSWTNLTNCTFVQSAAQAFNGQNSALMTCNGASNPGAYPALTASVPVIAGKQYRAQAYAYSAAGLGSGVTVAVVWLNAALTVLSFATSGTVALGAAAWTLVSTGQITAPAGAAFAVFQLAAAGTPAGGTQIFWDDAFFVRNLWTQNAIGPGPFSAHWSTGSWGAGWPAIYSRTGMTSMNLSNLLGLTLWVGLGSTQFYNWWAIKVMTQVHISVTLTDSQGNTASWQHSRRVKMSNNGGQPAWQKIRMPIPQGGSFNPAAVTGYSLTITSRAPGTENVPAGDLPFTDLYISLLTAVPTPSQTTPTPSTGAVYDMAGVIGSARAPVNLQLQQAAGTTTTVKRFTSNGAGQWIAPAGTTSVKCECVGPGGRGSSITVGNNESGGGGGGGEYAAEAALAVTAGHTYSFFVSTGGQGAGGASSGQTWFQGDSVRVTANGGFNVANNTTAGGVGGSGSTNTTHHNGGTGGAGGSPGTTGAGGGGGTGGPTGAGGTGSAGSGGVGGAGGSAGTGGTPAGSGGAGAPGASLLGFNGGNGFNWGAGGGGASAGSAATIEYYGGNGAPGNQYGTGVIVLTYTQTTTFKTLLVHRPNPDAPDTLCPFVSPSVTDTPNNGIEYVVPSLVSGLNSRFGSTYTVCAVNYAWNSPGSARTITVTVNQYEQPGGTKYSQSVALAGIVPNSLPGPIVPLGELTLPGQAMADDNLAGYFTVQINDTNTSDAFQDILFLDTMGQTVLIQSPNAYVSYWIDEPKTDRDLGNVMGSVFDRPDAVSVLQWAQVAGPTPFADPMPGTNQYLMVYAQEGVPSVYMTYWPRWMFDRIQ